MHRMRRIAAFVGLTLAALLGLASSGSAALIRNPAARAYPDISGDINGTVSYTYNSSTGTGNFHMTNTPYLIAGGKTSATEYAVNPNPDGVRRQVLNVALDGQGNLLPGSGNTYELYGTITTGAQTFSGLLLKGTPTAFGWLDLGDVASDSDLFDLELNITGGALADYFGADAYIRLTPELDSTFRGRFDENFTAAKATTNTRAYHSPKPFPVPEPTAVLVLLVGGSAFAYRQRRRLLDGR